MERKLMFSASTYIYVHIRCQFDSSYLDDYPALTLSFAISQHVEGYGFPFAFAAYGRLRHGRACYAMAC